MNRMTLPYPAASTPLPAAGPVRLLAFVGDAHSRAALQRAAAGATGAAAFVRADIRTGDIGAARAYLAAHASPDLLIIDVDGAAAPLAEVDALADACADNVRVIAIGNTNDVELFRGLRQLGVADYLVKPLADDMLAAALLAVCQPQAVPARFAPRAELVCCMGARGGVGATSVALSLAYLLAQRRRVVLLDLDLQTGSAALDIEGEVSPGLAALLQSPDRVDQALVEVALKPHRLGFRLLTAEEPLDRPSPIEPEAVEALLAVLGQTADVILIDMPRRLDTAGRALLRLADRVAIVTTKTLAGMRDSQRLTTVITGLRAGQPPVIVVNRAGETRAEVSIADFERALGAKPAATIPYQSKLAGRAAEQATVLAALAASSSAMGRGFADALRALASPASAPATQGVTGRLRALLHRRVA